MATWALCSLADATIFIAEVIFSVFLTDAIRLFISFNDDIFSNYYDIVVIPQSLSRTFLIRHCEERSDVAILYLVVCKIATAIRPRNDV